MLRPLIMLLLAAAATPPDAAGRTEVIDRAALARLRGNEGVSLQWIDWDGTHRGLLHVRQPGALVHIDGEQRVAGQPGVLTIDGDVLRIAAREFTFRGRIVITDTPDVGRRCVRDGTFTFRITGTRRYWRLQQMEACDGLTDYVDIYF
ncbi:hypothetical protein [uncultured Sphingomonas sp.]|jgi:hypothetical protein|uniref:hypothetical protein n=1 Tax=uncultured Sphingomonas sp. TaxID=158754 RepID=UPI0030DAF1BA